ncbi:hypothetical protein [Candidatus Coxiella mudrowiae]|uniref:hypothetical protein n=1 Tax=Candidatus Coxiella mudrowiae TaxID=2054173 RepID=UPI0009E1CF13|nr:hypothetical protein [Candidatus Coxiella mudrowiae]
MSLTFQRWALASISLGALLLKLIISLILYHRNIYQITQPDSQGYLAPAKVLLTGKLWVYV